MADWLQADSISYELFVVPKLDTWANVAEFAGIGVSITAAIFTLIIRKEVNTIKRNFTLDKRITAHSKKLKEIANKLNNYLNSYDSNISSIKTELGLCHSELIDLAWKLETSQSKSSKRLIKFISSIKNNYFVPAKNENNSPLKEKFFKRFRRLYKTTVSDIWHVHDSVIEIINELENIRQNRRNTL